MQIMQEKESTMVVWCALKIPSIKLFGYLGFPPCLCLMAVARYDCNIVHYICCFVLFIVVKTDLKLIMRHMGLFFLLFNLPRYNLKSGGLHF